MKRTPALDRPDLAHLDDAPEPTPPRADLRLLAPACAAWALLAATVAAGVRTLLVLSGVLLVAGVLLLMRVAAGRRERTGPRPRGGRHAAPPRWPALALLVVGACLLVQGCATLHAMAARRGHLPELVADRAVVTVVATVQTDPRHRVSRFGADEVTCTVAVTEVRGRGRASPAGARLAVRGGRELEDLAFWSTVELTGRLGPTSRAGPELAELRVSGRPRTVEEPPAVAAGAEVLRAGLRASVRDLPADARGLLPGLVIGDTSALPSELDDAMRATGMTHLTAVSGSNVSVVIGLVLAGCGLVGVPRRWRPWLALAFLAGFVVLARPEPSVLRAAAMGAIGLVGLSRSHRSIGPPLLAGAILVVLTTDPWLARSYGFVLSSLATLGLLLLAGPWGDALRPVLARRHPRLGILGPAVAVPLAAQVVCGPVIVLLQGSVPVVGVLANLLAAPLIPVATIGGVACAGVAVLSPTLGGWLAWVPALPTLAVARVARALAVLPGGSVPWPDGAPGAVLLAALTVAVLAVGRSVLLVALTHPLVTILVVSLVVALVIPTRAITGMPATWRLIACDVGQGDGLVLRSGPASAVVVDTGPDPDLIDGCLDRLDVEVVDAVVVTHFHADHVDGLPGVSRGRPVRALFTTTVEDPPAKVRQVADWARSHGVTTRELAAGEHLDLGEVTAEVWWPARRIDAGSVPNNGSVVLAVRTGEVDALLLGDIEREAGAAILGELRRSPALARTARSFDVVKTPHHGSANIDADLMAAVRAPVGIISVGADNDYGHPSPTQLALLRQLGYAAYRTDQRGDVVVIDTGAGPAVWTTR